MLADLHSHTFYSDGVLAPAALIERALANKLTHLAITDHDTTEAFEHLDNIFESESLTLIQGVEISCLWEQREIHVVGIGIDRHENGLQSLLVRQQGLRKERVQEMDMRLQKGGIIGLMRYIDTLPCKAISRNHVAQFLIDQGVARSKDHAFKNFLGDKGRFGAQAQWCELGTAISAIRGAGGIAVLAHPNRYNISNLKLRKLVAEFASFGGEGLEVSYSNLDPNKIAHMAALCTAHELWASTSSDFHTPVNHWMDLGKFRHLPPQCAERAIWLHPDWPGRTDCRAG
ncbi:MAG: PHP domain-containing protein [Gammaproteobacteria bacterium]|nr:PHP domain-containing protein [Gammaproteobacteria bacterium]MDP2140629.1 PHP domain-containing protein [Gammaproteobacteria bacterium]MDP2347401.1 PHP domain-containing protein [Gammaproteobacteria bacterium]